MAKIISFKRKAFAIINRALLWHFRHYVLKKDSPLIAAFQLTNRCDLKCRMCTLWKNPQKSTLPFGVFKRAIDDLQLMGCAYTSLSGGEPLVIKDVLDYLSYAARKIPFVNMTTNGQLLDSRFARELAQTKIDMVSISVDGLKKTHDEIRGISGSFDRAMDAIENLKSHAPDIGITVNTVISPWNLDELLGLVDLVERLGVLHKFQPIYHFPIFENQKIEDPEWTITEGQIRKLQKIIGQLRCKKSVVNSQYYLASIPAYFTGENTNGIFKERCKSVHFYCEMRENGRLFPCLEGMGWKGGFNIFDHSLKEIYYDPRYKEAVKGLQGCTRCGKILPLCYMESRIAFPLSSYIKYTLMPSFKNQ